MDDEPYVGVILARVARQADLEFACRGDAQGAHEFLQQNRPDLILLDVNLPGASGVELLRRLRSEAATAGLKASLFCQSGLSSDVAAGWAAGADYLVSKDLIAQPDALRQRLVAILAHAAGRPPSGSLTLLTNANGQTTQDWAAPVESVLSRSAARDLGGEVLEQVLRRAIERAFGAEAGERDRASWVVSSQGRLDRRTLPRSVSRLSLGIFFASLADQLWRLLGTESAKPLTDGLQAAVDRLSSSK